MTSRMTRLLAIAAGTVCVAFAYRIYSGAVRDAHGNYLAFSDFFARWSFGWIVRLNDAVSIHDADARIRDV
jgi:hypothetical protein